MRESFITPVVRTTLTADVCKKMVGHLLRGDWKEGDQIPAERELCQQLGVGRASLREALKALEIMGMIQTRLGEGTFVCGRSEFYSRPLLWAIAGSVKEDVTEITEARRLIETELAGLAAIRASAEDLKKIGRHLDLMEEAGHDNARFQTADIDFHLAIAEAAHNRILLNALHLIRNLMKQWIGSALLLTGVADEALDQHRRIFMAIAKKNPEQARQGMKAHLEAMAERLLQVHGEVVREVARDEQDSEA
jgi:GntR family transcriptional regulator, transcriptional repressor for pyruvate dehydrogenase complex